MKMRPYWFGKCMLIAGLCLAVSTVASAQYGGGGGMGGTGTGGGSGSTPGYKAPSGGYGSGKAIGIGVGAAAAAVGTALFLHHRHIVNERRNATAAYLTGCTRELQNAIGLTSEKDNATYVLVGNDSTVKAGRRVMLKGVANSNGSGDASFEVNTVVKDYGSCAAPSTVASAIGGASGGR